MEGFSLEEYLSKGVDRIVRGILKASFVNPRASLFMVHHGLDSKSARKKRVEAEQRGEHIPPFLIASITDRCNLHCKGCYARANHSCTDQGSDTPLLTDRNWGDIFAQAQELGVEFILLAGGEPFVRKDVLREAGKCSHILFPVFTNGTMIDESYLSLLDQNRNLLPVLSIEGDRQRTDARRGRGVFDRLQETMKHLHSREILFGASVTVTRENLEEVLSASFVEELENQGAKAVVYVEYVPMCEAERQLAPDDSDRERMQKRIQALRQEDHEMVFVSFPGDEKTSGGCLAAGRGFFHINARGGAEPCPFSPYSDTSVLESSLREALHSPLFLSLQRNGNLTEEHVGGCVLFEQRTRVEALLAGEKAASCE